MMFSYRLLVMNWRCDNEEVFNSNKKKYKSIF